MVKKFLALVLLVLAMLLPASVSAQNTQDFTIKSFEADYYLTRDDAKTAELTTTETIVAEFPSYDQNHGILRAIPKSYQDHTVSLEILSVTDEAGRAHNYSANDESGNLVLKIGDADRYVHGQVTYVISYTQKNVISFQDLDEFYWDVNGDQWSQSFDKVVARVHVLNDLTAQLSGDKVCFAGSFSEQLQDCTIDQKVQDQETIITFTAENLSGYQTLTFDVGFEKGTFLEGPEILAEKRRETLLALALLLSFLTMPIAVIGSIWFVVKRYRKFGRDPKGRGVIVPEYQPPKDFNVITSAVILKERLEPGNVSASIIELAVSGYLVIHETIKKKILKDSTEFELELVKDPSDLPVELRSVLSALFSEGVVVGERSSLADLKNKLYKEVPKISNQTLHQLFVDGYFRSDPKTVKAKYVKIGVVMLVSSFVIGFLLVTLPLSFGLMIGAVIIMISSFAMPAKTKEGVETKEQLLGLEMYMKLAEAERIKFLQGLKTAERIEAGNGSNTQKVKLFEKLLPYAVLFGIEKDWAKQFADLYSQPPGWYQGSNLNTFSAVYLASSLGSFNTAVATSFSAPSSSGSSGFGGGGSSGGGGGGGGGGGW